MAAHFKSFLVSTVYGVFSDCAATDWIADGPYIGSWVPATFATLNRQRSEMLQGLCMRPTAVLSSSCLLSF